MNLIREDKRINFRKMKIDSCSNCKFMYEEYDFYCTLAYTLSDDRMCENQASFISFDNVSDLDICDMYEKREGE